MGLGGIQGFGERLREVAENVESEVREAAGRVSDAVDGRLGLDRAGQKPITLTGVTGREFASMEAKVREMERSERPFDAAETARLARGEILTEWRPAPGGAVEERTAGVIDMPIEEFLAKMPLGEWGKNLVDWKGGETRPFGDGRQLERMVLRLPGKDLDMTKVETLTEERDRTGALAKGRVSWEVLKSDNGSVATDVGSLRFERFGSRTLVVWHSAHKLTVPPLGSSAIPQPVKDAVAGPTLSDFFRRALVHYRQIARGDV